MVGIMLRRKRAGIFCWIFCGGTGDDVGGPCVGIGLGGIITASEIDAMQLNESSPVSCKAKM